MYNILLSDRLKYIVRLLCTYNFLSVIIIIFKLDTTKGKYLIGLNLNQNICNTSICHEAASALLNSMNPKVNACDDFYEFVCGKYVESANIPRDKVSVDSFDVINDDLKNQLRKSIEEKMSPHESRAFKLAKILYKDCLNEAEIEKQGLKPLRRILKNLGEWPVIYSNWNEERFDWKNISYKCHRLGYSSNFFLSLNINRNPKNSSQLMISINSASLGLSRDYLTKGLQNELVQAYLKYMTSMARLLKKNINMLVAKIELEDIIEFEIKLAEISLSQENRSNFISLYNPMTIAELSDTYPNIPWLEYINNILAPYEQIDNTEIVNVADKSFIHKLQTLLQSTPKRVQANYAVWRVVFASVSYLNTKARNKKIEFLRKLLGIEQYEPRWKECVDQVTDNIALAVNAMYVRKYFDRRAKSDITAMLTSIRDNFRKTIKNAKWMDKRTRSAALAKIDGMIGSVGHPDELLDDERLDDYYEGLEITAGHYLDNILNVSIFEDEQTIKSFRRTVSRLDWIEDSYVAVANAFYEPSSNKIIIPAGILQGVFFKRERPQYLNYGAVGYVIGHEIIHGFDDQGSQIDAHGNEADWWGHKAEKRFAARAQCFVEQYSNYREKTTGLNINGINTQDENIADNAGAKQAYKAYDEWVKVHGIEPQLPGFEDYTARQMFWISMARIWCGKCRMEVMRRRVVTGSHSPSEFRVNGALANIKEFARDFNCRRNSRMNPEFKCEVW